MYLNCTFNFEILVNHSEYTNKPFYIKFSFKSCLGPFNSILLRTLSFLQVNVRDKEAYIFCITFYWLHICFQEFPILCQTCLGDNPYIRMVSQSRRPKLYDLTFQLNNNELIERNICLKLLDRSNKYKVLSWYLSF